MDIAWLTTLIRLREFCEHQSFKGFDVGDSIESPIITKTFLGRLAIIRFAVQQLTAHRFAYVNLRPLLRVPKLYNAKGIALFLNGYCNLYEILQHGDDVGIEMNDCRDKIVYLADLLVSLKNDQFQGVGWGYPIAWQGRTTFYFPAHTPTVVASSFAADALFHAYEITGLIKYKEVALGVADFILKSLHRTPYKDGFIFSYSPYKGNDTVFNASLLGGRTLAQCFKYSGNQEYLDVAKVAINTCVREQREDGAWIYGMGSTQKWIDNFHTGYNLEAIQEYQDISGDNSYSECLKKGLAFMLEHHFDSKYVPKYFHDKQYPIDIHCCGEIFVVLYKMNVFIENEKLADAVYQWTIDHMFDKKRGYFYFQKRKWITNKCPLMRWSEAFMFNALSYYAKSKNAVK